MIFVLVKWFIHNRDVLSTKWLIDVCIVNVNQEIHKHTENKISLFLLKEEKEYVLELQNISNNFCLCESFKYLYVVEYDRKKKMKSESERSKLKYVAM